MLLVNKVHFGDTDSLQLLSDFINPSVTGYVIEQAVLASIALRGLDIASRLSEPMGLNVFQEPIPNLTPKTDGPVLYIPQIFNYKAIDGVIVKKEQPSTGRGKGRLFIYPLQITVAEKHKDSHKAFFDDWKKWIANLGEFDVFPEFIWISKEGGNTKEHPETDKWPAHNERHISISQVNKQIGMIYEFRKRGGLIQKDPEILAGEQVGMEERGKPEEPGELEEQSRSDGPSAAAEKRSGKRPRADGPSATAGKGSGKRPRAEKRVQMTMRL
jgi:hypothetical protein